MNYYRQLLAQPPQIIYPYTGLRIILNQLLHSLTEERLYSSATRDDIGELVERFVSTHAESSSRDMSSQIFHAPDRWIQHPLMNFMAWKNGAVFHVPDETNPGKEQFFLWVNEPTAAQWAYPLHAGWFFSAGEETLCRELIRYQLLNLDTMAQMDIVPLITNTPNEEDSRDNDAHS